MKQQTLRQKHLSEYQTWTHMKQRCLNKKNQSYKSYGGRGVTICDRWKLSFEDFLNDMGARPNGMSLDRIDNDGNYEPDNCRWATWIEQANNTRKTNPLIEFNNKTLRLSDWADELRVPFKVLKKRLQKGIPVEKAFTENINWQLWSFYYNV